MFIVALIRSRAGVAIITRIDIRCINASAVEALNRICTNIIIFYTGMSRITFGASSRSFTFSSYAAVGCRRGAADTARSKIPAHTSFVHTMILDRTSIPIVACLGIGGIHAFPAQTLDGIRANVIVFCAGV